MALSALLVPGMGWQDRIGVVLGMIVIPSMWEFAPTPPVWNQIDYYDDLDDDLGF